MTLILNKFSHVPFTKSFYNVHQLITEFILTTDFYYQANLGGEIFTIIDKDSMSLTSNLSPSFIPLLRHYRCTPDATSPQDSHVHQDFGGIAVPVDRSGLKKHVIFLKSHCNTSIHVLWCICRLLKKIISGNGDAESELSASKTLFFSTCRGLTQQIIHPPNAQCFYVFFVNNN